MNHQDDLLDDLIVATNNCDRAYARCASEAGVDDAISAEALSELQEAKREVTRCRAQLSLLPSPEEATEAVSEASQIACGETVWDQSLPF